MNEKYCFIIDKNRSENEKLDYIWNSIVKLCNTEIVHTLTI